MSTNTSIPKSPLKSKFLRFARVHRAIPDLELLQEYTETMTQGDHERIHAVVMMEKALVAATRNLAYEGDLRKVLLFKNLLGSLAVGTYYYFYPFGFNIFLQNIYSYEWLAPSLLATTFYLACSNTLDAFFYVFGLRLWRACFASFEDDEELAQHEKVARFFMKKGIASIPSLVSDLYDETGVRLTEDQLREYLAVSLAIYVKDVPETFLISDTSDYE